MVVQQSMPDVQLAIVGKALWRESELVQLVRERRLDQHVVFTVHAPMTIPAGPLHAASVSRLAP